MNARTKVMYLNPVGTSAYDEVFADMARRFKCPDTEVHIASLNPDSVAPEMNNLEYRAYESLIVADTVRAARQAALSGFDAMAIGCFYDPALLDAREISGDTVVVGPCQASITAALNVANNFSIIIGRSKWEDQMKQAVHEYGFGQKLASFETAGLRVEEFHRNPAETRKQLELAAARAVEESKAKSIILGCTLEVGFYAELQTSSVADRAPYLSYFDGTQHSFVDVDGWSQEIPFTSNSGGPLNWQFGCYYLSWERLRSTVSGIDKGQGNIRAIDVPEFEDSTNPTGVDPGSFLSFVEDSYAQALFGSVEWAMTDQFSVSVAGRYDRESREQLVNPYNTAGRVYSRADASGANHPYGAGACSGAPGEMPDVTCGAYATFSELLANTRPSRETNEAEFSKFQPKVTLGFAATDEINLYGSWGIGYRAGQFNYPGIGIISATANEFIEQEENSAFEVGVKGDYGNFRFNAGARIEFDLGAGLTFFARADYERRGEQYWTPENTHPRDTLSLVNLRAGLEGDNWATSLYVNNAGDKEYNSEVVTPLFVHPAPPRVWRVDFRYNF